MSNKKKGRIALINGIFNTLRLSEPIGICSITTVLRNEGHEVHIIEPRLMNMNVDDVAKCACSFESTYIGISTFSFEKEKIYDIAKKIKDISNKCFVVIGGLGPTLTPELYLHGCDAIDAVICGEGEYSSLILTEYLLDNNDQKWKYCPGIAFMENGEMHAVPPNQRIENLDKLPFMARDILELNIKKYGKKYVTASIMGSRGCFGDCSYCWISQAQKKQPGLRYRQRSILSIVEEIMYVVNKYGVTDFSFEDDNFIPPGKEGLDRVIDMRNRIMDADLKITFFMQTRPDTLSDEILTALKDAGLTKLFIGIEAIGEQDLDIYNKKYINKYSIKDCLDLLKRHGFTPDVGNETRGRLRFGYIAFHQMTTIKSIESSVKFFRENRLTPKRLLTRVNYYEGDIDIKKRLVEKGLLLKQDEDVFAYPKVDLIYKNIKHYSSKILPIREKIRDIEKHVFRKYGHKKDLEDLIRCREIIDTSFYDCFDLIIEVAKDNYSLKEMDNMMKNEINKIYMDILNYIVINCIEEKIREKTEIHKVIVGMHNIYW
jgi:hypothetical protein